MNFKKMVTFVTISSVFALTDGPVSVTASGIVPFVVSFNTVAGDGSQDAATDASTTAGDFATVTADDYDRVTESSVTNYFDIADIIVIQDFDANHHVDIRLTKGGWTVPSNYAGSKLANGSENTEFLVKVSVTTPGYAANVAEGLVVESGFDAYTGLDENVTSIIKGGTASHGVEDGAFDVDARVLFDWLSDIPGTYTIALTMSVIQGS